MISLFQKLSENSFMKAYKADTEHWKDYKSFQNAWE